uniref:F-box domain-containing protein n=1 Tax=Globodera rostochiensis TaxID=31243 RepID=A0A914HCU0_GLORO
MPPPAKKVRCDCPISDVQQPLVALGSIITPIGTRGSARIANKNKSKRRLREIFICGDVWLSVFSCLKPVELGLKLALLSYRFNGLVDTHFKRRKLTLGSLCIQRSTNGNGAQIGMGKKKFPIPQEPLHPDIIGFKRITLWGYIDSSIIAFLSRIRRVFESDIALELESCYGRNGEIVAENIAHHIWPILKPTSISKLRCDFVFIRYLRTLISPTFLYDCTNLRLIHMRAGHIRFPKGTGDDSVGASTDQMLFKWLHTPREDSRPNVLRSTFGTRTAKEIEELKATFLSATTSASFIFVFDGSWDSLAPFEVENRRTRERLTFRGVKRCLCLLLRGPTVRDVQQWTEFEREALEANWLTNVKNVFQIDIFDKEIGPLWPPRMQLNE